MAKIESLEDEIRYLDMAMAVGNLEYEELNSLYDRKLDLSQKLDGIMDLWLSLSDEA